MEKLFDRIGQGSEVVDKWYGRGTVLKKNKNFAWIKFDKLRNVMRYYPGHVNTFCREKESK